MLPQLKLLPKKAMRHLRNNRRIGTGRMSARRSIHVAICVAMLGAMAGCGPAEDKTPGGVSPDEAKALDAAAEMLDKRELPDLPEATAPAQEPPAPAAS